jgi:lauroyl/myristoyl acyltransferase
MQRKLHGLFYVISMRVVVFIEYFQRFFARIEPGVPVPPALTVPYDMRAFGQFMREETGLYSPAYARQRVRVQGRAHLRRAARQGGVVLAMLHHGSWILAGGAVAHQLRMPYTVVASRRSLDHEPDAVRNFWLGVHQRGAALYGQPLLYTDEPAFAAVRWLQKAGHVLGVVLDVREGAKQTPEHPFAFCGQQVFLQTGPARLARVSGATVVPAVMVYDPAAAAHQLHLLPPVARGLSDVDTTQAALAAMSALFAASQQQAFYDILGVCGKAATE